MKRSGAVIAWNYFFEGVTVPKFLLYIQDRDLWNNSYPDINEFVSFFYELEFKFEVWEKYLDDSQLSAGIEIGAKRLEYKNIMIERSVKNNAYVTLQDINGEYNIISYINSNEFRSELGNELCKRNALTDFACIWSYQGKKNQTSFSLRSLDEKKDVKEIVVPMGGGGIVMQREWLCPESFRIFPSPLSELVLTLSNSWRIPLYSWLMHAKRRSRSCC